MPQGGSGPAPDLLRCPFISILALGWRGEGLGDFGAIYESHFLSLLQLSSPSAHSILFFSLCVGLKMGEGVGGSDSCVQTPGL